MIHKKSFLLYYLFHLEILQFHYLKKYFLLFLTQVFSTQVIIIIRVTGNRKKGNFFTQFFTQLFPFFSTQIVHIYFLK